MTEILVRWVLNNPEENANAFTLSKVLLYVGLPDISFKVAKKVVPSKY